MGNEDRFLKSEVGMRKSENGQGIEVRRQMTEARSQRKGRVIGYLLFVIRGGDMEC